MNNYKTVLVMVFLAAASIIILRYTNNLELRFFVALSMIGFVGFFSLRLLEQFVGTSRQKVNKIDWFSIGIFTMLLVGSYYYASALFDIVRSV